MYAPTPNPIVDPFAYAMEGVDDVLPLKRLDWAEICRLAPSLEALEREVQAMPKGERDWREWSIVKRNFSRFVGWEAPILRLRNPLAYDITYSHLLAIWEGNR